MNDILHGFFNDGGTPVNPDLISKPGLCVMCKHDNDSKQEMLCALTRMDQQGEDDFQCDAYEEKG